MKAYVQFQREQNLRYNLAGGWEEVEPYLQDILGTEGIYILDGRTKLHTMIQDTLARIKHLRFVQPSIAAFEIHKGNLKASQVIYKNRVQWFRDRGLLA